MLKMGFIGFGKSANRYHIPYILNNSEIQIKTIFDLNINEELAIPLIEQGIKFTTDIYELLNDPEIELVTICTPPHTHYELAQKVILSGKSVIVEKPFVDSLSHAKDILTLAKQNNVIAVPYQNRRFDGDYLAAKSVIEQGYLGDIVEVESHIDYFRPNSAANVNKKENGNFYGLGIHLIDRMVALFGRPESVSYDIRNNEISNAIDNYFDVDLHYSNLKVKVKSSHLVAIDYPRFIIHGTKGSFIKYGQDQQENDLKAGIMPSSEGFGEDSPRFYGEIKYQNSNGDWIEKQIKTPIGNYGSYYQSILDTIKNSKPTIVTEEQILTTMEILEKGFTGENPSILKLSPLKLEDNNE
jgi:predicted dehydrogenase